MRGKNPEEHAYRRIEKDIKGCNIPSVVVLMGSEDYLVNFYAEKLCRMYVEEAAKSFDMVTLSADKVTLESIVENTETISIMSARKVVYIPEFFDSKGRLPDSFRKSENRRKGFLEYIKEIPKDSLLILTACEPEEYREKQELRKSPILREIASVGSVYDFGALDRSMLNGFIDKRLRRTNKIYRSGIPSLIGDVSGYGNDKINYKLFDLENDIRKLVAYVGERDEITADDVRKVVTANPENNIFAMVDAAGKNRKDTAFRLLHNLLESGEPEFRIIGMLTDELEIMLMAKEMKDEGKGIKEIHGEISKIKKGRIMEFRVKKALEASSRFPEGDLKRILAEAYEISVNIITGIMPAELALEYFIGRI